MSLEELFTETNVLSVGTIGLAVTLGLIVTSVIAGLT